MKNVKISVITVSYNAESTLENTILSVINQSYENKEFIIIDGKSTDSTVRVISQYQDCIDHWVSEPDRGIPDALNKGIKASSGEWLYFLSSDDVFADRGVLERMSVHLKNRSGLVYGNVILRSVNKKFDGRYDVEKILRQNICHQAQFYHRDVFKIAGFYNIRYRYLSDYEHTLRLFADKNIAKTYIDETISIFNDEGRTSYLSDDNFWEDRIELFVRRFKGIVSVRSSARGFANYMFYSFRQGSVIQGLICLSQLLIYTQDPSYIKAAYRNWKSRKSH